MELVLKHFSILQSVATLGRRGPSPLRWWSQSPLRCLKPGFSSFPLPGQCFGTSFEEFFDPSARRNSRAAGPKPLTVMGPKPSTVLEPWSPLQLPYPMCLQTGAFEAPPSSLKPWSVKRFGLPWHGVLQIPHSLRHALK